MKIKDFFLAFLALVFSFSLVAISILYISQSQIQVQASDSLKKVNYHLAYPGILPDSPLYWLKMIRDKILLSLTRKPKAKFSRLLLYADKRIGAAEILVKSKKIQLGITTATKAEKYLEKAVNQFKKLDSKEKNQLRSQQLLPAILKHKEILNQLEKIVPDQTKPIIKGMKDKNSSLIN